MASVGRIVSLSYGYQLLSLTAVLWAIFKYFLVGFSIGTSRIAGFGEGTPQQDLPKGQNRRYADFGTVVESCSKKLPLSSATLVCGYTGLLHQYSDYSGVFCPPFTTTTVKRVRFGKRSKNFLFSLSAPYNNPAVWFAKDF